MKNWIFLVLFSSEAFASDNLAVLCPNLSLVTEQVKTCQFNPIFLRASEVCLKKLNAEISVKTSALALVMSASNQTSDAAQAAKLANQGKNLGDAKTSLETLRANAVKVRSKLEEYRDNFMRAGRVNKNFAARLSQPFLGILESFPCYKDNHAKITNYITVVNKKISEIDGSLAGVSGLSSRTMAAKVSVGNDSAGELKKAGGVNAQGAGFRAPASPNSSSTITGVEEDAAKQKK